MLTNKLSIFARKSLVAILSTGIFLSGCGKESENTKPNIPNKTYIGARADSPTPFVPKPYIPATQELINQADSTLKLVEEDPKLKAYTPRFSLEEALRLSNSHITPSEANEYPKDFLAEQIKKINSLGKNYQDIKVFDPRFQPLEIIHFIEENIDPSYANEFLNRFNGTEIIDFRNLGADPKQINRIGKFKVLFKNSWEDKQKPIKTEEIKSLYLNGTLEDVADLLGLRDQYDVHGVNLTLENAKRLVTKGLKAYQFEDILRLNSQYNSRFDINTAEDLISKRFSKEDITQSVRDAYLKEKVQKAMK